VNSLTFDTLVCQSLEKHQMIVLGIYRLLNILDETKTINDERRIVIYYPPNNYLMHSTDMVRILYSTLSTFKIKYYLGLCYSTF